MLRNYLTLAFRNIRKHKLPASINIGGLALGIACCLLLFLYIDQELRFDRFHENGGRIFRVNYFATELDGDVVWQAKTPPFVAEEMSSSVPEVENVVRVSQKRLLVRSESLSDEQQLVEFADPTLFDVFSFELARGDKGSALNAPGNVILSAADAQRYFGNSDPMGQTLSIDLETGPADFTVTGVLAEIPENSSLQFHILLPDTQYQNTYSGFLKAAIFGSRRMPIPTGETYVRLRENASASLVATRFPAIVEANWEESEIVRGLSLQPLADIHMNPQVTGGMVPVGNPMYVWLMGGVALIVLSIAGINFVTLMLGRSVERAREVGVRKVVGADRRQIRYQFWGEALVTSTMATLVGFLLAELFLPTFNSLAGKSLVLDPIGRPIIVVVAALLTVGIAVISGAYPAVVLSRFHPARVLKGRGDARHRNLLTRILVTTQFALSISLIAGMLIMEKQLDFLLDRDLGFNPDRIVVMNTNGTDDSQSLHEALRTTADSRVDISDFTGAFFSFGTPGLDLELQEEGGPVVSVKMNPVESNYLEALGIELISGKGLTEIGGGREIVVNEAFVRAMGWTDPVGRMLPVHKDAVFGAIVQDMPVVGVVEDFNTESLHAAVKPLVLVPSEALGGGVMAVSARLAIETESEALAALEATWRSVAPDKPFRYEFLQDVLAEQYREEQRWRSIISWSGGLVMLIACVGLFGLAVFSIRQRTKEIGIRKVLGASAISLVSTLGSEYARLVAIGAVLSVPVTWLAAGRWLEGFAFRIDLGPGVFLLAGFGAMGLAVLIVGWNAFRAAGADPVKSLRYE